MSSSQQPGHHRLEAAGRDAGMATENSQQPTRRQQRRRDGSQSDAVTRSRLVINIVNNVTRGTGDKQVCRLSSSMSRQSESIKLEVREECVECVNDCFCKQKQCPVQSQNCCCQSLGSAESGVGQGSMKHCWRGTQTGTEGGSQQFVITQCRHDHCVQTRHLTLALQDVLHSPPDAVDTPPAG